MENFGLQIISMANFRLYFGQITKREIKATPRCCRKDRRPKSEHAWNITPHGNASIQKNECSHMKRHTACTMDDTKHLLLPPTAQRPAWLYRCACKAPRAR